MPEYTYAEPKDAAEASARIDHWMGDLNEFQKNLGLHHTGTEYGSYYPRFSGEMGDRDLWAAYYDFLYPDHFGSEAPVPPLKHAWLNALVRTRDDVVLRFRTAIDLDVVKTRAIAKRDKVITTVKEYLHRKFFGWLVKRP